MPQPSLSLPSRIAAFAANVAARQPWLMRLVWPTVLLALAVLAVALRRYRLGGQGLWFDEADLVARAHQSLPELLAAFGRLGENGPLYTVAMAAWIRVAGDGELAIRLPSALAGGLAAAALAELGRRIGDWRLGLAAGGLLAVSPYAVWYGQDAKMYALVTLLVPLGWLCLLTALRRAHWGWWVGYLLLSAVAFLVHITLVFVWLSQVLVVGLAWRRLAVSRRAWLSTTLAVGLPLAAVGAGHAAYVTGGETLGAWQPTVPIAEMFRVLSIKFAVNRADAVTEWRGQGLFLLLATLGAGLWWWRMRGRPSAGPVSGLPVALGGLLVPVVGFVLLTLRLPLFQDRYLMAALPAYLLLVAAAIAWPPRWAWPVTPLAVVAVLAVTISPLRDVVFSTESQKEDWRAAYQYIDQRAREGDVVIVHPGYLRPTVDYYARRLPALARLPLIVLPSLATADFGERELDAALADLTWGKTRVWLVTSPDRLATDDPRGLLRRWYEGNTLRFADQLFNGVHVETFSYNGPLKAGLWRPEVPLDVGFGDAVTLVGATWDGLAENHGIRAGGWARLTLRWQASRATGTDLVVRVRLRDAAGREVARYDIAPLDGYYPTTRWVPGQVWDYHDLPLPQDLAPGTHTVVVGLYPVGKPEAGLLPSRAAAPEDPLGVVVGTLQVTR